MILSNGAAPFSDVADLASLFKSISNDTSSALRPVMANANLNYKKVFFFNLPLSRSISFGLTRILQIISQCWSHDPALRPNAHNLFKGLHSADPRSSTHYPTYHPATTTRLTALFSSSLHRYILELESAQSRLSTTLSDTLSTRLRDSESKVQFAAKEGILLFKTAQLFKE
jgi:hypothetical protein